MKFSELHPEMTGMSGPEDGPRYNQLTFDCPKCGPPFRIQIHCHQGEPDAKRALWHWHTSAGLYGWDVMTISPSISNHHHGRRECGCHLSVTDGEVLP